MRRFLLTMVVLVTTISLYAQDSLQVVNYGAIYYTQALESMPDYKLANETVEYLKAQYAAELKHAEDEFNDKYETFLSEQSKYAPAIKRKRQQELEAMLKSNEQFRNESLKQLEQKREELIQPLRQKLDATIALFAEQNHFSFVLNLDNNAVPYLNPFKIINFTDALIDFINK